MAKEANIADFLEQLSLQVANHSIYVWGGSGNLCKDVDEAWIRKKESRCDGGKHADDAVAAWEAVMASPYANVARCFDCSGYVSYCLTKIGALDRRTDCDGLYAKCNPTKELKNGTLLFRVNSSDPNDETHVGVYFNGYQFHSKGRKYGVVREKFSKNYWYKYGWFKKLIDDQPSPEPEPTPDPDPSAYVFTRVLKKGCNGDDVIELKKLLIAHGYTKGITVDTKASVHFGSATKSLVKSYQKDHGLKVDGIAGNETITSLGGVFKKA